MDYKKIREEAARHVFDFYPPDRQGRGFICPICGNGTGDTGDGVTFIKDSYRVKCFKCQFTGDIIDLKAKENNCSYNDAARIIAVILGIADEQDEKFVNRKLLNEGKFKLRSNSNEGLLPQNFSGQSEDDEPKFDQVKFFMAAEKNLHLTDYPARRGLSLDTARYFRLGFVKEWRHPKIENAPASPRLIIPTSRYSYLARDVRQNLTADEQKYSKQKVGQSSIFNTGAIKSELLFVVEGEFDAMSFYEIGLNAIALGSTSNYKKFVDLLINTMPNGQNFPPNIFILALDNDKGGRTTTRMLRQILNGFGLYNVIAEDIYGNFKDANDALVASREKFYKAAHKFADNTLKNFVDMFN